MPLPMARPWKHPTSGVYWLRRRVPNDLRALVGKREEKRSLATRDPDEAKVRHAQALAEIEARWSNLRRGRHRLSRADAQALAAWAYQAHLDRFSHALDDRPLWDRELGEILWQEPCAPPSTVGIPLADYFRLDVEQGHWQRRQMRELCQKAADDRLAAAGFAVDDASRMLVARAIGHALQSASHTLARWSRGDYRPDPQEGPYRTDQTSSLSSHPATAAPVPFGMLIEGWAAETRPSAKTLYSWRREFAELASFLNHADAARLTASDLIRWKGALIQAGLHGKTIRDAKLAAIRAVLRWGVENRRLQQNVAERVTIEVRRRAIESKRGYTDDEARLLLQSALNESHVVRRWAPWICAYTGARLSEVCQLRCEDIRQIDEYWCMSFAPEAGSLKTLSSERTIPVHPALIERGFTNFAQSRGTGVLFTELSPDRYGNRGGNGTKVVGRWVRSLGLTDPRLSPSHSWRHRFKTLARRHGLATDIVDAIVGHRRRTVGDAYGEFPLIALVREIEKIPTLQLDPSIARCKPDAVSALWR